MTDLGLKYDFIVLPTGEPDSVTIVPEMKKKGEEEFKTAEDFKKSDVNQKKRDFNER